VSYQKHLNRHLSLYKRDVLRIEAEGVYKRDGLVRPHILPIEHSDINLLPEAEAALSFLLTNPGSRHVDFHHLNSSQAFALNLFFPYFSLGAFGASLLLAALGQDGTITKWEAEAIPVAEEESNIDFVWDTESGVRTFCEVKLSESAVGSAIPNEKRLWKLRHLYREVLADHLPPSRLEPAAFFASYQFSRNVWHMLRVPQSVLIFLAPRANSTLWKRLNSLNAEVTPETRKRIRIVAVEDVITSLLNQAECPEHLREYPAKLHAKYIARLS
jgi:hypothetical protein